MIVLLIFFNKFVKKYKCQKYTYFLSPKKGKEKHKLVSVINLSNKHTMRNFKKKIILAAASIFSTAPAFTQTTPKLSYFNLQDVRLTNSPFKHAEDLNLNYLLALDADKLLAPFFREAGLQPKAASYTNWENSGLD